MFLVQIFNCLLICFVLIESKCYAYFNFYFIYIIICFAMFLAKGTLIHIHRLSSQNRSFKSFFLRNHCIKCNQTLQKFYLDVICDFCFIWKFKMSARFHYSFWLAVVVNRKELLHRKQICFLYEPLLFIFQWEIEDGLHRRIKFIIRPNMKMYYRKRNSIWNRQQGLIKNV